MLIWLNYIYRPLQRYVFDYLRCIIALTIDSLLWYPLTFILSSIYIYIYIYMHKEGKQKSNDIKYAQVNETKVLIYCRSSKLNGTKNFFFWSVNQINYGNVEY